MIVKVDFVLLAAPGHCEIWGAAKDSFKNRTNYVNYRTIFQFRMICRACVWQSARRSHWGLQRQRRVLLGTTAGWMFCMSNQRDFHNIIATMLRDLSAQDHVLREERTFRGGGAAGEPLGIFLLGTAWFLSPDWEHDPGAGGLSRLATGSSHVQSVHIRISQEGRETKAGRRLWQRPSGALWYGSKPCVDTLISLLHLFIYLSSRLRRLIDFNLFSRYSFKFLSALVSLFLLFPPEFICAPLPCPSSQCFHRCRSHFSCLSSYKKSFCFFPKSFKSPWNSLSSFAKSSLISPVISLMRDSGLIVGRPAKTLLLSVSHNFNIPFLKFGVFLNFWL